MKTFYTAQEVADLLKIKKTTVYELVKKNQLPASKIGKQIRISPAALDEYLKQNSEIVKKDYADQTDSSNVVLQPVLLADAADNTLKTRDYLRNNNGLIISGQDESISIFCAYFQLEPESIPVIQHSLNLYDSLYSLYFEKVHAAFAPLLKEYGEEPLRYLVPGTSLVSVQVAEVSYGIYIKKTNPYRIQSIHDLTASGLRVMFGEKGSICRIVLDQCMKDAGLRTEILNGCKRESISSFAAAAAVDSGQADAAIGSSSISAHFPELELIPLCQADIKLIFHSRFLTHPSFRAMISTIQSEGFKRRLTQIAGYDCRRTGEVKQI